MMNIGCFALVEPFSPMKRQFKAIAEMGIQYADVTDNHTGASLGVEFDFAETISLASRPGKIKDMLAETGLTLSTFCAHGNLLDPASPDVYGTNEIIQAIKLASLLGIKHVITTEGHSKTRFAANLTAKERIFTIKEKLQSPIEWADELGVELILEPHGIVTDNVQSMGDLLNELGDQVGICLDTGNSWLGGANPVEYVTTFGNRIKHVHWKDLGEEWVAKRGTIYGCGMGNIKLGEGQIDVKGVFDALKAINYEGGTTMEIFGPATVMASAQILQDWDIDGTFVVPTLGAKKAVLV